LVLSHAQSYSTTLSADKETDFWQSIKDSDDAENFEAYLDQFPSGSFASLARIKLNKLEAKKQVAVVKPPRPSSLRVATLAVGVYPQRLKPGHTFKDCSVRPEMVVVPAENF